MSAFSIWFLVALALLVLAVRWLGRRGEGFGVLHDGRERISLNHFQSLMWTLLIGAVLIAAFVSDGFQASSLALSEELLILLGISGGSAVTAGAIKADKDDRSDVRVGRRGAFTTSAGKNRKIEPALRQLYLEEEGDRTDQAVNVTKLQNFLFTALAGLAFVALVIRTGAYPVLPEELLWLIGVSHAGYLGGKLPKRP